MHARKLTVIVREDHQVVMGLLDDFPVVDAEVSVLPRPTAISPREVAAEFDRLLASVPTAPVIALDSLDRGELNR
jgi:hypothetical protein